MLDFRATPPPIVAGKPDGDWVRYDTPAEEFLLRRFDAVAEGGGPVPVPDGGPRILLCTAGSARVRSLGGELEIGRGGSVWLGAADTNVTVAPRTDGTQLFLASDALTV